MNTIPCNLLHQCTKKAGSLGLTVTSNYFAAEDGVTERSRRFLHFQGSFIGHRLTDIAQFHIADKVEDNLDLLLPVAAGFVRRIHVDLP